MPAMFGGNTEMTNNEFDKLEQSWLTEPDREYDADEQAEQDDYWAEFFANNDEQIMWRCNYGC